jgi:holin-like protein
MIAAILLLLACQLVGEAIHRLTGLPLPGTVIGMFLLLGWLHLRPGEHAALKSVATWLIAHIAILFVPATMGLIEQGPVLARYGVALVVACVASSVLTLVVTALTFRWVVTRTGHQA